MTTRIFSYGSNLHLADLDRYADEHGFPRPELEPIGPGWLDNRRLSFGYQGRVRIGGCLDVRPAPGHRAPGYIFEVRDDTTLDLLDHKEGHPDYYRRLYTRAQTDHGELDVLAWEVTPARRIDPVPPSDHYLALVRSGYERWGLPIGMLLEAAAG